MPFQHTWGRRSSGSCIISGKCCGNYSPTHASDVSSNVNNVETSKAPAVCEISIDHSSWRVRLRQKCIHATLPKNTIAGEALECSLVGIWHQRNYKTSCAKAVHLFEDDSKARRIVRGISESPCTRQATEALIVVLRGVSRNKLRGVLYESCLLVNVLQVLYNEVKRGQGLAWVKVKWSKTRDKPARSFFGYSDWKNTNRILLWILLLAHKGGAWAP